jgi:lambda repressor-like predicted transcriptional regulator
MGISYDPATRQKALERVLAGENVPTVSLDTGISESSLRNWRAKALHKAKSAIIAAAVELAPEMVRPQRAQVVVDTPIPDSNRKDVPRILIYDIETLPNRGYFFECYSDRPTPLEFIDKPKAIVTIAYKFLGDAESRVLCATMPYEDALILKQFLPVWESADYAVAHFGNSFDKRFLAARLMANNLPSLPPVTTVDTCLLARSHFGKSLNSNRLDHLGEVLGVGRKNKTKPDLWVGCANGDPDAIREMAAYNQQDTELLEKVFVKLLPHVRTKINHNLFVDDPVKRCNHCGSDALDQRGFELKPETIRHRFYCRGCGSWSTRRPAK